MVREIDRPVPIPCLLVVKKGSFNFSVGIPGPESEIETTAADPPFISVRPITARPFGIAIGIHCGIDDGAARGESFNPLLHFHHRRAHEINDIQSCGSLGYLKCPNS